MGVRFFTMAIPTLPPSLLTEWIQPGALLSVFLGVAGFLWAELKSMRAEFKAELKSMQTEFKAELRSMRAEFKTELRASETRSDQKIDSLKAELQASEARSNQTTDSVRSELKAELRAGEARSDQKIDEVKVELREIKDDVKALLLAQTPRRPPVAQS